MGGFWTEETTQSMGHIAGIAGPQRQETDHTTAVLSRYMLKINPHPDYPPEEGRYIRGNDFSPAAVAIILNCDADKIPPDLEGLVRAGIESGAALSGTVQTENIGFEKMICNTVANPNIRYLILGGPESEGHRTGEAMKALLLNGVDEKKRILGTNAPHPLLFNLPVEFITMKLGWRRVRINPVMRLSLSSDIDI